jgi:hypothetical protein
MRAELAAGRRPQDIIGYLPGWGIDRKTTLNFHPHPDRTGPERHPTADRPDPTDRRCRRIPLGELRADCLIHRQPSTNRTSRSRGLKWSFADPAATLRERLDWRDPNLSRRPLILIDSQRSLCNSVRMKTVVRALWSCPLTPTGSPSYASVPQTVRNGQPLRIYASRTR